MTISMRHWFNQHFTTAKYQLYCQSLNHYFPGAIPFRIAETPVFIDKAFKNEMIACCESIVDKILAPDFKKITNASLPKDFVIPNESQRADFMVFDFGICEIDNGKIAPRLIEMQGFPSLFNYQIYQDATCRAAYDIPQNYSSYLNGFDKAKSIDLLRKIIVGNHQPENVVLLELNPEEQKTKVDFYFAHRDLGISIVNLLDIRKEGNDLFYPKEDKWIQIHRIYNRVIFDDVKSHLNPLIQEKVNLLKQPLNVEWCNHPDWFYRISKYTIPFLQHPCIPETHFVSELTTIPSDLENFVLKPLFSFSGIGVNLHVQKEDLENLEQPENYILQRKVQYAPIIDTPTGKAKAEIRIFYMWPPNADRPVATYNLARITKGEMIGVSYNKDETWVGGSLTYFEQ